MFYDKFPYPINSIINEKYIAWPERVDVIHTLVTRITYLGKWVNDECLDPNAKENQETISSLLGFTLVMEKGTLKKEKRKFYKKKTFNKQRETNIEENIITNQSPKNKEFLGKQLIVLQGKTTVNARHEEK